MGYQQRDKEIIDYEMFELAGVRPYPGDGMFRGPRPTSSTYIACVGAAQTFGCFCEKPFPVLLTERLAVETLNLGSGGASPTFHNSNSSLMRYINDASLVIVQVLSGRSQSNSMFRLTHHGMEGERVSDGLRMTAEEFFEELVTTSPESVPLIVKETRQNYVRDMCRLLQDISPPKILFWFSVRPVEYTEEYTLPVWKLWGAFPQFVNREMIDEIKRYADEYVECVTDRGLPQLLITKDGKPALVTHSYNLVKKKVTVESYNRYYPSPEMQEDAATLLEPVCRKLLVRHGE